MSFTHDFPVPIDHNHRQLNTTFLTWPCRRTPPMATNFCGRTRREMLWQTGSGFAGVAMTALMDRDGFLASQSVAADGETPFANPLAPKQSHFEPKAKNVIFLYMYGGPSQVDTFDYKPSMYGMDGKTIEVFPQ